MFSLFIYRTTDSSNAVQKNIPYKYLETYLKRLKLPKSPSDEMASRYYLNRQLASSIFANFSGISVVITSVPDFILTNKHILSEFPRLSIKPGDYAN